MALPPLCAAVINFLFLVLTCGFILPVFVIKMQHQKEEIGNFRICCFDLRRLALFILLVYIIKIFWCFLYLQNLGLVPCNRGERFLYWIDVILMQFFVALRSRLSLSSTESKWYIFGLIFISLGIIIFLICFVVIFVLKRFCWETPLAIKLAVAFHDIGVSLYSFCIFIIPLRKTIELLQVMSNGNQDIRLRLFAKKITFYSSVMIGNNILIVVLLVIALAIGESIDMFVRMTIQNSILLIDCYCVAAQFDVDLDKVDNSRTRRMLMVFDCNTLFAHSPISPSPQQRERIQSVSSSSKKGGTDTISNNRESTFTHNLSVGSAGSSKAIEMQTM